MENKQALKLSVLDQSPVRKGGNAKDALQETVKLAKLADELGYTRYWVSEHHNTQTVAGSTPEVLMAHLAGITQQIRIGSGGIMLPNHSALKVAENFRMLETLFPGRIDLGMGRAPGTDRITASILNPSNTWSEQDFVQQLIDLQHYLNDTAEPGSIQEKVRAIPQALSVPALWLLSSSGQSGLFAAHFGMAFTFAHFINPQGGAEAVKIYRTRFQASENLKQPQANLAIFVLCAETEEKAMQLQAVMDDQLLNMEKGIRQGFPDYEEVRNNIYTYAEQERIRYNRQRMISGTADQVKSKLTQMAEAYQVDEIIVVTITHHFADRVKSYELLADAFELEPRHLLQESIY